MYRFVCALLLLAMGLCSAHAQQIQSHYAGQEGRAIKALSSQEVEGYLAGHGMGFAKAAELNHYPGPKHVIELADTLQISKEQLARTKEIFLEMRQSAVLLGKRLVKLESKMDRLFVEKAIDVTQLVAR